LSVPSVRSRLVSAKYRSNLRRSAGPDRAVSWCTTTSGFRPGDRAQYRGAIQPIEQHRLGPEIAQRVRLGRRPRRAGHGVPALGQHRYQAPAQGAAGAGEEDPHDISFSWLGSALRRGRACQRDTPAWIGA
jgi:hypothetical protein